MLQQLGGVDASFLYMETPETPMHIGSLYLYELPGDYRGDFYDNFKAQIAARLHLFPVFTRKLAQLPFDIGAPIWVPDDNVDLDYHIRRHTVPKPGRFDQLEELVGRLHSNFLDRSRPLWEIYIIDGLADGRVAEYTKFHHAGFDGAASMSLVQSLYDTTPVPRPIPAAQPSSEKKEELDFLALIGLMYTSPLRQYLRTMQAVPDFLKAWAKLSLIDPETLKLEPPELPQIAPWTRLNVSITSQRSYAARTVSLQEVKHIAKAHGVTVNDAVLAVCAGALRRYLRRTHDLPEEPLTAFVPISVREAGNTEMNNQTIGMICSLATDVANPIKRLMAIHESSRKAKELTNTIKGVMLGISTPFSAPPLLYGLMNMLGHYHLADRMRPIANLTISNNIGSPVPLYLAGARLVSVYPISIPTHGSAVNITVQSYCDKLDIGLVACRRVLPDVGKLGDYVVDALTELKVASARAEARHRHPAASPEAHAVVAPAETATRTEAEANPPPAAARAGHRSRVRRTPSGGKGSQRPKAAPQAGSAPEGDKPKFPYIVTNNGVRENDTSKISSNTVTGAAAVNALGSGGVAPSPDEPPSGGTVEPERKGRK